MSDEHLIRSAYDPLSKFVFEEVPESGAGSANDFRVRKALENLTKWLDRNAAAPEPEPGAALLQGPRPGGWLAHTRTPDRPYWPAPLWLGLRPADRTALLPSLEGVTVPVILRIIDDTRAPFVPVKRFDGAENVSRTVRLCREIQDAGGRVLLFGSDDNLPHRIGWEAIIDDLVEVARAADGAVDAACPGIEMDEWSGRSAWRDMGLRWRGAGLSVDLWCHFTQEMYWNLSGDGYAGILWQDKDLGHDGSVRSAFVRHAYLLDETKRDYLDDRIVGSPARSAQRHDWRFCYFEYGVPVQMTEADTEACRVQAMEALRKLGMEELHG